MLRKPHNEVVVGVNTVALAGLMKAKWCIYA